MGQTISFIEAEKKTWINHNLQYDHTVRSANLKILEEILEDEKFVLSNTDSGWGNVKFQHWFFTNGVYYIEFGTPNLDIYSACVTIVTNTKRQHITAPTAFETKLTAEVRQRIRHVLGMNNYSLCLRNCEHVANYIARGRWISHQMDMDRGHLFDWVKRDIMDHHLRIVNSFPSDIQPHVFRGQPERQIYSFLKDHFVATQFSYYLDYNEDTYNIILIGPTGAGKSHLINLMFNDAICESKVSHSSVTREIYFIRGKGMVYDVETKKFVQRNIVVTDTIGLCDTEWAENEIISMIKGRVSSNIRKLDAVFIVFKADRLQPQHVRNIKHILQWLDYEKNRLRICFISTFADFLDQEKKNSLREEAEKIFNITSTVRRAVPYAGKIINSLIYTGFPPEDALNALTRGRVDESWDEFKMLMTLPGKANRIDLKDKVWACNIL